MQLNILLPGFLWKDLQNIEQLYTQIKSPNFDQLTKYCKINYLDFSYSDLIYSSITYPNKGSLAKFYLKIPLLTLIIANNT